MKNGIWILLLLVLSSFMVLAAENVTDNNSTNETIKNVDVIQDKQDFGLSTTMIIGIILFAILLYYSIKMHLKIIKVITYIILLMIVLFMGYSLYHYSLI